MRAKVATTLFAVALFGLALFGSVSAATAQLPFDVTGEDLASIEAGAMAWTELRDFVGGVDGELEYRREEVGQGECRAVAVAGTRRLRRLYTTEHGEPPLTLRLAVRCGARYEARLTYDGLVALLEIRGSARGDIVYRGRHRGLP